MNPYVEKRILKMLIYRQPFERKKCEFHIDF